MYSIAKTIAAQGSLDIVMVNKSITKVVQKQALFLSKYGQKYDKSSTKIMHSVADLYCAAYTVVVLDLLYIGGL